MSNVMLRQFQRWNETIRNLQKGCRRRNKHIHRLKGQVKQLEQDNKEMLGLLKDVSKRIDESDQWWMDYPDRGGFDQEKIDALIARMEG